MKKTIAQWFASAMIFLLHNNAKQILSTCIGAEVYETMRDESFMMAGEMAEDHHRFVPFCFFSWSYLPYDTSEK